MNNKLFLSVLATLLLFGSAAAAYYTFTANDGPKEVAQTTTVDQTDPSPVAEQDESKSSNDERMTKAGSYIDYSESSIASTMGTKVLFFHAPWCSQCREMEADIQSVELPADVTIFKTDYDSNQELRQKYGVTLQTTFVAVDDKGDLVEKYVAYNEPTYEALERDFISKL